MSAMTQEQKEFRAHLVEWLKADRERGIELAYFIAVMSAASETATQKRVLNGTVDVVLHHWGEVWGCCMTLASHALRARIKRGGEWAAEAEAFFTAEFCDQTSEPAYAGAVEG